MKLITKEIAKKLLPIGGSSEMSAEEIKIPLKMFNPCGGQSWYVWEFDGKDEMYGYVNLGDDRFAECGYISFKELQALRLPFGLSIERDIMWDGNTTLAGVREGRAR